MVTPHRPCVGVCLAVTKHVGTCAVQATSRVERAVHLYCCGVRTPLLLLVSAL